MDVDLPDDSDFEPSGDNLSQASDAEANLMTEPAFDDGDGDSASMHLRKSRWERLQPFYNDRYLELFREAFDATLEGTNAFEPSQHGAVRWEASEKAKLFDVLSRAGRHDLPRLAKFLGSKSELEIRAYLERLRNEEADRQMFEKQTKNISHADIPAAIELGPEVEARLEKAADALASFQDQYDLALAQQTSSSPVVVTLDMALKIDEQTERELERNELEHNTSSINPHPRTLFKLSTFLDLSESLFMHGCHGSPKSHWKAIAEHGEQPSITIPAIEEFHHLVFSLLQRLIQTTIFVTESRLRAATTKHKTPKKVAKDDDVECALKILKMKLSLWEYWIRLPRRAKFNIVAGSKRKGDSVRHGLGYDEVEAALSVRQFSGRRRSLSVSSHRSGGSEVSAEESDSHAHGVEDNSADDGDGDNDSISHSSIRSERSIEVVDETEANVNPTGKPRRYPVSKRKRMLEDELDEYLDVLDGRAKNAEEARISALLGFDDMAAMNDEDTDMGRRPKVLRRSIEEVRVWKPIHQAEWEAYPKPLQSTLDQEAAFSTVEGEER